MMSDDDDDVTTPRLAVANKRYTMEVEGMPSTPTIELPLFLPKRERASLQTTHAGGTKQPPSTPTGSDGPDRSTLTGAHVTD